MIGIDQALFLLIGVILESNPPYLLAIGCIGSAVMLLLVILLFLSRKRYR